VQGQNLDSELMSEAGVSGMLTFAAPNMEFVTFFVSVMILLLTAANSFAPYAATGGNRFKVFLFMSVMMFISGVAVLVVPRIVSALFEAVAHPPEQVAG
jgi:archaellum biogenesis protein FlaJ (TadC family)